MSVISEMLARMPQDPTARTLLLLSLLQSRTGWTVDELAARLEVSGRTVCAATLIACDGSATGS